MQRELVSDTNPNYLHGCYPLDLSDYFGESEFSLIFKKAQAPAQQIPVRLGLLNRILTNIDASDFAAKDYFAQYMRHKYRRNCQPNTLRQAATSLTQFFRFYRDSGKQHLQQMSREDIEAFIEYQQDRGLKPRSVRTRLCAVYAFIHFLIEYKVLGYELLERRIKIKLGDQLPRAMDAQDVKQLLSVIDHVRDRALILLLLRTGMRIGELLNTKVDEVDLSNQRILIYQADKTGLGRVVYYSGDAQTALLP